MANFTPNFNLKKPLPEEFYNVADQNSNMDIVDSKLKDLSSADGVAIPESIATALGLPSTASVAEGLLALDKKSQCVVGSYIGTGTFGSNNKNSLTLPFEPKLVIVVPERPSHYGNRLILIKGISAVKSKDEDFGYSNSWNEVTFSGSSVSWYNTGSEDQSDYQLNTSDQTYCYAAFS